MWGAGLGYKIRVSLRTGGWPAEASDARSGLHDLGIHVHFTRAEGWIDQTIANMCMNKSKCDGNMCLALILLIVSVLLETHVWQHLRCVLYDFAFYQIDFQFHL